MCSAFLTECEKKIEFPLLCLRPNFAERSIGLEIGLDDRLHRLLGIGHYPRRGNQPHLSNHRIETNEIRGVVLLVAQRVGVEPTGFRDEIAKKLLLPGLFSALMLVAKLRPVRCPCGRHIGQATDQGTGQAEDRRGVSCIHL